MIINNIVYILRTIKANLFTDQALYVSLHCFHISNVVSEHTTRRNIFLSFSIKWL